MSFNQRSVLAWCPLLLCVGGCSDDGGSTGPNGFGDVGLVSSPTGSEAYAYYGRYRAAPESCLPDEEASGCTYRDCELPNEDGEGALSAGRITIEGGARELTLRPNDDSLYGSVIEEASFYEGREQLVVRVAGSTDVPPHKAEFEAPTPVAVGLPDLSRPVLIDRAEDFAVSWTGGSTETVQVSITRWDIDEDEGSVRTRALWCDFRRSDGGGSVPTGALERLPVIAEDATALLSVGTWTQATGKAGFFSYWFHAAARQQADVILE